MSDPRMMQIRKKLVEIAHLRSAMALANHDQSTYMLAGAADDRAEMVSFLSLLWHQRRIDSALYDEVIAALGRSDQYSPIEVAMLHRVHRDLCMARAFPSSFIQEWSRVTSRAQTTWREAREKDDFSFFEPHLTTIVALVRRRADYLWRESHPYDALIDEYEPGATTAWMEEIFGDLRAFLVPFIRRMRVDAPMDDSTRRRSPAEAQMRLGRFVAEAVGFDFRRGVLTTSTHPYTTEFSANDVRITTRIDETDEWSNLYSVLHEAGHGLYEQGLPAEEFGTPLGETISLGIHESQSRLWENQVGRSLPFLQWLCRCPLYADQFREDIHPAYARLTTAAIRLRAEDCYRSVNRVEPSFIRTEADEVTYNLHIILRFELEKALVAGDLEVADLPAAWNEKVKMYFGLDVPSDRFGVLQDTHWSCGSFGYFPTYTLGNLYAAQFFAAFVDEHPSFFEGVADKGNFAPLLMWLRENIHRHGRAFGAQELCQRVTGSTVGIGPFCAYLQNKFGDGLA